MRALVALADSIGERLRSLPAAVATAARRDLGRWALLSSECEIRSRVWRSIHSTEVVY
jgi:hypothetical protein